MDLSYIFALVLAHAKLVGLALLGAGVLVRFVGRSLGRYAFLLGGFVTIYLASREWQSSASWAGAGGILVVGLFLSALLAWVIRAVTFVVALSLLVVAWYLLLYGWIGAGFVTTTVGSMMWVAAALFSILATDVLTRFHIRRLGLATRAASMLASGRPLP